MNFKEMSYREFNQEVEKQLRSLSKKFDCVGFSGDYFYPCRWEDVPFDGTDRYFHRDGSTLL